MFINNNLMNDIAEVNYKGSHVILDISNFFVDSVIGGNLVFKIMREAIFLGTCHEVHSKLVILGDQSPPGFTSIVLIDESHISAHCYSDIGLLAIDCFTCGSTDTEKIANYILEEIKKEYPNIIVTDKQTIKRFPY
jgi:S-adenosylmethionine decarboxylase